jgi:GH18 family chitinase
MLFQPRVNYNVLSINSQHNVVPEPALVWSVTHVTLAFMRSDMFNDANRTEWPLFTTIEEVRAKFAKDTVIQVAIGGWGDTAGFEKAAKTEKSMELFAENVKAMLDATGGDGVDIDWEYPGGNGEDYKVNPNSGKRWQIEAYPKFLRAIRSAIGPSKTLSAAVPGLSRDMLAFTRTTIPKIMESVDFLNVMTYDMMNRRDHVTKHHTGVTASVRVLSYYLDRGVPPAKANLGLAFYVKWFKTAVGQDCSVYGATGCPTELMEDRTTGADLGKAGAFSWHDEVPAELSQSFAKALKHGSYDAEDGGHSYWDKEKRLFWSWESTMSIQQKVLEVMVQNFHLGGAFAWGLGEDAPEFHHLKAASMALSDVSKMYFNYAWFDQNDYWFDEDEEFDQNDYWSDEEEEFDQDKAVREFERNLRDEL